PGAAVCGEWPADRHSPRTHRWSARVARFRPRTAADRAPDGGRSAGPAGRAGGRAADRGRGDGGTGGLPDPAPGAARASARHGGPRRHGIPAPAALPAVEAAANGAILGTFRAAANWPSHVEIGACQRKSPGQDSAPVAGRGGTGRDGKATYKAQDWSQLNMIGLVLVTHGQLADEFRHAVEHVVGPQEHFETVSIGADDDSENRRRDIIEAVKRADTGQGVIILTDMFGGTPSNLAISIMRSGRVEVIAGVNLPMLIKLTSVRASDDMEKALAEAQNAGRKYINVASQVLAAK